MFVFVFVFFFFTIIHEINHICFFCLFIIFFISDNEVFKRVVISSVKYQFSKWMSLKLGTANWKPGTSAA